MELDVVVVEREELFPVTFLHRGKGFQHDLCRARHDGSVRSRMVSLIYTRPAWIE
jgi:hypothetical protein